MSYIDSIKARLRNRAQSENRTFQEILTVYGIERALYRLSISSYSSNFVLKGGILQEALLETFANRNTSFDTIVAFDPEFARDPYRKGLWTAFQKAKKTSVPFEFDHVMKDILSSMSPIIYAIKAQSHFSDIWDHARKTWVTEVGME